jgi:ABC-type sugar transport system permease subunit
MVVWDVDREGSTAMRKTASIAAIVVGIVMALAGLTTWFIIRDTLSDQRIVVSDDADCLAGDEVDGPFSAFCQARVIDKHTKEITGGKTYAELDQDDPNRPVAADSAFLQASLFTSVVAFGVAAMAVVVGIVLALIGFAIRVPGTPSLQASGP